MWKMARGAPSCRSIPLLNMLTTTPMPPSEQPILQVRDLVRAFGGIVAVNNFSLDVYPGSIHGLIGPERCRQDHNLQRHQRLLCAVQRQGHLSWRGHFGPGNQRAGRAWAHPDLSGHDPVSSVERARQCPPRLSPQRQGRCRQPYSRPRPCHGRRCRREGARHPSSSSPCSIWPTSSPPTYPMVISGRWAWPWRSPPIRS